ncbi:MAG: hypothetical protein Q4A34_02675 [Candidatus Saccharibacteria bacterium]|nr:hypothetical protein [Candidatus Saccharibacteria bacterium]
MKKRNIIYTVAIISGAMLMYAPAALAAKCGGAETAVISCSGEGQDAIFDILKQGIKIMTGIIGVVAVGVTAYGGVLYAQSGSSPEMMKKAKDMWINVVIGLIAYAFLVAITNFLIPGGVF